MRADQYEAMAREFPAVRHDQALLTLQPTGCARDLEQLPVIREKRARASHPLRARQSEAEGVNNA